MSGVIRVLHVDDDPEFTDLVAAQLEGIDTRFEVDTRNSARDGIEALTTATYDCIVSDYDMPGQDGIEFLRTVRTRDPDVPFVLFTAKGSESVASEAISAGVTDYLQKETGTGQYELLANRLVNAVNQSRALTELAETTQWYRTLLEHSTDFLMVVDADREIQYTSPSVEEVIGYSEHELEGSDLLAFIEPTDFDSAAEVFDNLVNSPGERVTVQTQVTDGAGQLRWVEISGRNYLDHSAIGGVLIDIRDINDRKEREAAIHDLHSTATDLMAADSRSAIADTIVETLQTTLSMPINGVWFHDEPTGALKPEAISQQGNELVTEPPTFASGDGLAWNVFVSGEAQLFDDVSTVAGRLNPETAIRSEIILPLGDHGIVTIGSPEPAEFDDFDLSLAEIVTSHAATALDRLEGANQLRDTRNELEDAIKAGAVGTWDWDVQANTVSVGAELAQVLDLDGTGFHEGVAPEALLAAIHPDDRSLIESAVERALDSCGNIETEIRVHSDNTDEPTWLLVRGTVHCDDEGRPRRFPGVITDITQRMEQEDTIRDLQARSQELIRATTKSDIATVAIDIAEDILGFSLAGIHLVDESGEVMEPAAITDGVRDHLGSAPIYYRDEPAKTTDAFAWRIFESGEPMVFADSETHPLIESDSTPSRSGIIRPLGDHGLFITTSTEPTAYDEVDQHLTEMFALILTAALDRADQERALQQQKRHLQEKSERLDEFASIVTHDLRNPLTVADGRLALAADECDSEHIEAAQSAMDRMNVLITDILTYARMSRDGVTTTPTILGELVERSWSNVEAPGSTLEIGDLPTVAADDTRVQQLLENVLRNAIDHGGDDVSIHVGSLEGEPGFYIADSGPDIGVDDRKQVFESGYSTDPDGTGFGLAIVKQIADSHGWSIRVMESQSGGTRFEFSDVTIVTESEH